MTAQKAQWDGELHFANGWAHYHGPAGDTSFHAHYPVQLVFSADQEACVTLGGQQTMRGHTLKVPSNVPHILTPSSAPIDLLYIEPTLLGDDLIPMKSVAAWQAYLQGRKPAVDDPRIVRVLDAIDTGLGGKITQAAMASTAGMSQSSFTKLFRASVGMPLRRYVLWRRLNIAVGVVGSGADATTAAHKAGFSDSAHFSRTMRETFGVSPTDGLLRIKVTVADSPPRRFL